MCSRVSFTSILRFVISKIDELREGFYSSSNLPKQTTLADLWNSFGRIRSDTPGCNRPPPRVSEGEFAGGFLPLPTPNELIIAISEWMPGSGLPGCICYETKKKQIMQTKETRRHAGGIPKPNDKKKVKRNFSHIL